jgi:hypothetical protein
MIPISSRILMANGFWNFSRGSSMELDENPIVEEKDDIEIFGY